MGIENQNLENLDSQQLNPWENLKTKQEIGESLDERQALYQMIWKIENDGVKSVLLLCVNEWRYTLPRMKEEICIYNDSIGKFSDEKIVEINDIISKYNILPSAWVREIAMKDQILSESDPKVRELMEISLKSMVKPSVILESRDFYEKLATVESQEEKDLIVYYLKEWYSSKLVNDEYEIFGEITSYEYKDENLKNFILSLIKNEKINPSFIELYFDLFKDREYSDETENYMRWLLNQPKK